MAGPRGRICISESDVRMNVMLLIDADIVIGLRDVSRH